MKIKFRYLIWKNIIKKFPIKKVDNKAFKILLINISTHFTSEKDVSEYDVLEPPLGIIALQSYLNHVFKDKINGKLIKSRIDFDSYEDLNNIIDKFQPDLIGVSAMTFHKDFFHNAIKKIRENGYKKMIVVGGPHPTTSYREVLKDPNIDVCVLGEGEVTLSEIINTMINEKKVKLDENDLKKIHGIAFADQTIDPSKLKKDPIANSNSKDPIANGLYADTKAVGQY